MIGYVCILFCIVGGGLLFPKLNTNKKNRRLYTFLVFGLILLYATMRGESVGLDNANRYATVRMIAGFEWDSLLQYLSTKNSEPGYSFIIWIITRIIPSPHFIGVLWDSFIILTFAYFFYQYSEDLVVTSLMYAAFVFAAEMNITRQYIAAAIFLFLVARLISLPAAMGDYIPVQKKAKRSAKATREIPEAVSAETDDSAEVEDIPETESNDEE